MLDLEAMQECLARTSAGPWKYEDCWRFNHEAGEHEPTITGPKLGDCGNDYHEPFMDDARPYYKTNLQFAVMAKNTMGALIRELRDHRAAAESGLPSAPQPCENEPQKARLTGPRGFLQYKGNIVAHMYLDPDRLWFVVGLGAVQPEERGRCWRQLGHLVQIKDQILAMGAFKKGEIDGLLRGSNLFFMYGPPDPGGRYTYEMDHKSRVALGWACSTSRAVRRNGTDDDGERFRGLLDAAVLVHGDPGTHWPLPWQQEYLSLGIREGGIWSWKLGDPWRTLKHMVDAILAHLPKFARTFDDFRMSRWVLYVLMCEGIDVNRESPFYGRIMLRIGKRRSNQGSHGEGASPTRQPIEATAAGAPSGKEPTRVGSAPCVVLPPHIRVALGIDPDETVYFVNYVLDALHTGTPTYGYFVQESSGSFRIISESQMKQAMGDG